MRELEEELKKTSAGRKFLEEAEPCEDVPDTNVGNKKQKEPCGDAVSRKDLERLKRWRLPYDTNTTIPKSDLFVKLTDIRALPPVTSTQRWIPVSERLPEKDVEVLATTEWGEVTIAIYCVIDWLIHEGDTNAETNEIVAWMPLPEPMKVGEE